MIIIGSFEGEKYKIEFGITIKKKISKLKEYITLKEMHMKDTS